MSVYEDWSRAGWRAHLPGLGDIGAHVASLGAATIHELAAAAADRVPDRVALDIDGARITHATLNAGAARVASWLASRLSPGGRVLIVARSSPGFARCYLGALRAGAVVVLANPGSTAAELGHLAADSGAAIAFADGGPARLLATLPRPPLTVDTSEIPPGRATGGAPASPDAVALLAYTSGTTGRPKAVPLTHRQLLTSIRPAMAAWRWGEDDVLAHALPLFHQHGLGGLHAVLIAGGTARLRSRFTAPGLAGTVRQHRASVLFAVPTMYRALLEELGSPGRPLLASVRLAVCGSAPLSPLLAERLSPLLAHPPLVRYGLTETGLNVSHTVDDVRAGSVGVPLPGVMARIWSQSEKDEAPHGTDGEIQIRGPSVFGGYAGDPAATAAAFGSDGWFRTGDIGRLEPRTGHLEIRGRIKEMIITGGLNVYPREVELVLESHPAVAEAAVAGLPHDHWGEQVTAWVVLRPGSAFDEAGLISHVRATLAGYKCPKRVYPLTALPRNQVGKIVRSALTAGAAT
jgi:acyl-CoA synthetase (AMP-forming)/AMP-acid ligase II